MVILDNNLKVTGVKITPRNIFILDADSQMGIINNLKNFYNQIDFEFWLVVADRPVDISVYMSQLQLLYNQTQSPAIRKLITEDIQKGNSFMNNNVVDTEYFILFKEKRLEIVQKRVDDIFATDEQYIDENGQKCVVMPFDEQYRIEVTAKEDCEVLSIETKDESLENFFISLTGGNANA